MKNSERFAKYSDNELAQAITRLEARIEYHESAMAEFKAEKNIEFFRSEEQLYNDACERLMDVKAALAFRTAKS